MRKILIIVGITMLLLLFWLVVIGICAFDFKVPDTHASERQKFLQLSQANFKKRLMVPESENSAFVLAPLLAGPRSIIKQGSVEGPTGTIKPEDLLLFKDEPYAQGLDYKYFLTNKMDKSKDFQQRAKDSAKVEDLILSISNRPYFVWPSTPDYYDFVSTEIPNFLALRCTFRTLAYRALYKWKCCGQKDQALKTLLKVLPLAVQVRSANTELYDTISVACSTIVVKTMGDLLANEQFDKATYREVLQALESLPWQQKNFPKLMDLCYDDEMRLALSLERGYCISLEEWPLSWVEQAKYLFSGFYMKRQDANDFFGHYKAIRLMPEEGRSSWDYGDIPEKWQERRSRYYNYIAFFDGERLLCALQLYKLDHHQWPSSLEQLAPKYLSHIPYNWDAADGKFNYKVKGQKMELSSTSQGKQARVFYPR